MADHKPYLPQIRVNGEEVDTISSDFPFSSIHVGDTVYLKMTSYGTVKSIIHEVGIINDQLSHRVNIDCTG